MGPLVTLRRGQGLPERGQAGAGGGRRDPLRRRAALRPGVSRRPLREAVHRLREERVHDRAGGDLRADPLHHQLRDEGRHPEAGGGRDRRGDRASQRRAAGALLGHLHRERAGGGDLPVASRQRLRHRQREHRHQRRRDRRRVRRREGHRRRSRVGLGCLEGLHAPADQHGQLEHAIFRWPRD